MACISPAPLLKVHGLTKTFPGTPNWRGRTPHAVHAVSDVSFSLARGETLGVVGESGCGKTTLGRCILRLIEPTAGEVTFDNQNIRLLSGRSLRTLRRKMQIVFQDPFSSLNPRATVGATVKEGMIIHDLASGSAADHRTRALFEEVGLDPAFMSRYPHEFSGGQRQRIGIARALSVNPDFLVCDEAVSALDVSVQAQIIALLRDLQRDHGLTYLFISHDLAVVQDLADRVAVMYLGRIVELGPVDMVYRTPRMPYTQALLSAVPAPNPAMRRRHVPLRGDLPSPAHPPPGCVFFPRCHHPAKDASCTQVVPALEEKTPGHFAACIKAPVSLLAHDAPALAANFPPPRVT